MMTNDQKRLIAGYRNAGYGYKKIALIMGISVSTVKTHCRRNGLGGFTASAHPGSICKCCGALVEQTPGRKEKKFCSDECRHKWWNSHRDLVQWRVSNNITCGYCGREFVSYGRKKRVYCSRECYDAARRERPTQFLVSAEK